MPSTKPGNTLSLFKAYDLRGRVPEDLNEAIAYQVGRAYTQIYAPKKIAIGFDIRSESPAISKALVCGVTDGGCDVMHIGLCGTEEVYFATFNNQLDGGVMVTASHNPKGHNGMKIIGPEARPINSDTGLFAIRDLIKETEFEAPHSRGQILFVPDKKDYIRHILSYIDLSVLKPLRIVVNPGNGGAGPVLRKLQKHLPFKFIYENEVPDGSFPNGVPNPLLPENQKATRRSVIRNNADLGIAWDGDFDRCFFFDSDGRFIEGYYLVGLLAKTLLARRPGADIIHDPRLTWNTIEQTRAAGGNPVQSKCGHAFIKEAMRERDAIYGGEMSAHHYFKDFSYCDSGMIPWLLICELMSRTDQSMKELVGERMLAYPCSGEINFRVAEAAPVIAKICDHFKEQAKDIDRSDGISMSFENWRFNLRASNTEHLLRLNVEARENQSLVQRRLNEMVEMIEN